MHLEHHIVRTRDGTAVDVQTGGNPAGLPIVVVNGPAANLAGWTTFVDTFGPRHRIVSWDQRGFFRSECPLNPDDLGPVAHAADLEDVLHALGIDRAVFLSWSLGNQIQLELYRRAPERFLAFISVNGTDGDPFGAHGGALQTRFRGLARVTDEAGALVSGAVDALRRRPGLLGLGKRLRLVSRSIDATRFAEMAEHFADQPYERFAALLRDFALHDARDVVPTLRCPTLFVAGKRDAIVPVGFTERMAAAAPHADLMIIPIASHYIPIEFAEYLQLKVEAFLEANGVT